MIGTGHTILLLGPQSTAQNQRRIVPSFQNQDSPARLIILRELLRSRLLMNRFAVNTVAKPGPYGRKKARTAVFCGGIWIIDYLGINKRCEVIVSPRRHFTGTTARNVDCKPIHFAYDPTMTSMPCQAMSVASRCIAPVEAASPPLFNRRRGVPPLCSLFRPIFFCVA